jgi:hypothetical protein
MAKELVPIAIPMPNPIPRKIVPLPPPPLALSFTLPSLHTLYLPYPLQFNQKLALASALALSVS